MPYKPPMPDEDIEALAAEFLAMAQGAKRCVPGYESTRPG